MSYTETQVREQLAIRGHSPAEIEIILKHFPWGYSMEFNGQNCEGWGDTMCDGWDGLDRRCECGNRRVSWIVEGNYAYGEAY